MRLKGIGPQGATVLLDEAFHRRFSNRRENAAYAGLVPSPWQSGGTDHEQGISKAGNARLRGTMTELAWLWLRHQPGSALSVWFMSTSARPRDGGGALPLWPWPENSWLPCGAMSNTVSCPKERT